MVSKFFLKVKLCLKLIFLNKLRLVLTIVGMCIALFLLGVSIEIINTYTYNQYKKVSHMNRNVTLVKSSGLMELDEVVHRLQENQLSYAYTYYKKSDALGNISYRYKENELSCNISIIGSSNDFDKGHIFFCDLENEYFTKTKMLYGNGFTNMGEVGCIIERSTSQILFGKDNSLGEKIEFTIEDIDYEFVVCGIIEDRPTTLEDNLKINASLHRKDDIMIEREVFVPLSWFNAEYKNNERSSSSVIFYFEETDAEQGKHLLRNSNYKTDNIEIIDYQCTVAQLNETRQIIQIVFNIILVIVFIVSGLIVMNTLFFSVKDRIREIGIRRALGAKAIDIIYQIVVEGIIYSIIAYVFVALVLTILFAISSMICLNYLGIDFILRMHNGTFILLLSVSIIEGILFSLLPAIYATKINTINAIVFT